jgi:hypothetical protein
MNPERRDQGIWVSSISNHKLGFWAHATWKIKAETSGRSAGRDLIEVNTRGNPYRIRAAGWTPASSQGREDVVAVLHELYVAYPGENHAVLAQALLQARKNISPHEGEEAVRLEVARLLEAMGVLRLETCES